MIIKEFRNLAIVSVTTFIQITFYFLQSGQNYKKKRGVCLVRKVRMTHQNTIEPQLLFLTDSHC